MTILKFYAKIKMSDTFGSTEKHWVEITEETHDKLAEILSATTKAKRVIK